ncbi:MAG: twin-arginine translocase TatA/TatE family subunit [Planctomycetaceae bacterium]|nr:twin-arginine translocase TatA/TatE family subunit [Planctomycetaceae bacterium]
MGLGPMEMIIIGIIAIMLFGNRLPEVAKSVGKGFSEFKKGMHGIEEQVNSASSSAYSNSSYKSTASRPARSIEDREEASAPKFEPPPAESST